MSSVWRTVPFHCSLSTLVPCSLLLIISGRSHKLLHSFVAFIRWLLVVRLLLLALFAGTVTRVQRNAFVGPGIATWRQLSLIVSLFGFSVHLLSAWLDPQSSAAVIYTGYLQSRTSTSGR